MNFLAQYGGDQTYAAFANRRLGMIYSNVPDNNPCYVECDNLAQHKCWNTPNCI